MSAFHTVPYVPTKEKLRALIRSRSSLFFKDPSTFGYASVSLAQFPRNHSILVTNHPRRSWFARITRASDGSFTIK